MLHSNSYFAIVNVVVAVKLGVRSWFPPKVELSVAKETVFAPWMQLIHQ